MKILHTVESYLPSRHGMQEVVTQLSQRMVKMGHDVTVATSKDDRRIGDFIEGVRIIAFDVKGNYSLGIQGELDKYINFLEEGEFDIITHFAAQQWATDLALPILPRLKAKKVFVPTGFSGFYNYTYSEYFLKMQKWIQEFDSCVFLSNDYRDINFAKRHDAKNIVLIPNGANKTEFDNNIISKETLFKRLKIPPNSFVILNVGSHTGMKGHHEAIKIFKQLKLKNTVLCIVGNHQGVTIKYLMKTAIKILLSPFKKFQIDCYLSCEMKTLKFNIFSRSKKILNLNLTREETVALYLASDLFLFPSNIECSPIVLFECGAAKLPFLTNDVGNSTEIIKWTNGGMLLKTYIDENGYSFVDINDACEKIKFLYQNPEERNKLGENGYQKHLSKFNWDEITNEYVQLYKSLLN